MGKAETSTAAFKESAIEVGQLLTGGLLGGLGGMAAFGVEKAIEQQRLDMGFWSVYAIGATLFALRMARNHISHSRSAKSFLAGAALGSLAVFGWQNLPEPPQQPVASPSVKKVEAESASVAPVRIARGPNGSLRAYVPAALIAS